MSDWKQKLKMRLPALVVLVATLLFWGFYDRYELDGPVLLKSPSLANATRLRGDCTETNGHYYLNVPAHGKTASINFRLQEATKYSHIRVRARMKVDGVVVGKYPWSSARLLLTQYDDKNKWIPGLHAVIAEQGTRAWATCEDIFEIDPRAENVDVVIQQIGDAGSAEFDQIVAEPVKVKSSFNWWRLAFAGVWVGMGALYFRRCRMNRRKLRVFILLNVIAILFGTLMPENWIEDTTEYTKQEVAKTIGKPAPSKPSSPSAMAKPVQKQDVESTVMDRFNSMVEHAHQTGHFVLFASLCFLVYLSAALERQHRSYYFKVAFDVLLFAAVTESLQFLTMDRTPGIHDWLIDACGMAIAFAFFLVAMALRRLKPQTSA